MKKNSIFLLVLSSELIMWVGRPFDFWFKVSRAFPRIGEAKKNPYEWMDWFMRVFGIGGVDKIKLSRRHVQCCGWIHVQPRCLCRECTCGKYQRKRVGEESVNRVQIPSTGFSEWPFCEKKFMYEWVMTYWLLYNEMKVPSHGGWQVTISPHLCHVLSWNPWTCISKASTIEYIFNSLFL